MTDVIRRVRLIEENGDCCHCLGDHKSKDCSKKDRICGNGKEDRGCGRNHCSHELLCPDAKCFTVQQNFSTFDDEMGSSVVLSIMRVSGMKKGTFATVFWDLGSTSNFVREGYAQQCGFKGRTEKLCVTTLGGVTTEYRMVTTYACYFRDEDGIAIEFRAHEKNYWSTGKD